jgi:tetratricopeptide (TPR) repeat protein
VFELLKMIITRSLETGEHSDAAVREALSRTTELLAYAEKHFGEQDDLSIDASNMLANIYRRMGDNDKAIRIYDDILKETKAKLLLGGSRRAERLAGAHMQMANTLRDKAGSERSKQQATDGVATAAEAGTLRLALENYEDALKVSLEGLGHDSLNTQYCRLSLANCLRALRDDCSGVEALGEARDAARRKGDAGAAAKLVEVEASYRQGKEHQSRCEVFYRQAVAGLSSFKALDNVSISARLSHASVLMEIAAGVDDPFDDTIESEARALLTELRAHCEDRYGKLEAKHECTIYVHAKLGELNMRFDKDAHVRSTGKHMVQEALRLFADIRLPSTHPRVVEARNALKPRAPGRSHSIAGLATVAKANQKFVRA